MTMIKASMRRVHRMHHHHSHGHHHKGHRRHKQEEEERRTITTANTGSSIDDGMREGEEGKPKKGKKGKVQPGAMVMADLWKYNLVSKTWNAVNIGGVVPVHRYLHAAVSVNDGNKDSKKRKYQMVLYGGVSWTNEILKDVWVFDPLKGTWLEAVPKGDDPLEREGHTMCLVPTKGQGDKLLVFGGISYDFAPYNDVMEYSVVKNKWTKVKATGDKPEPRWLHTAVMDGPPQGKTPGSVNWSGYKAKMYVYGGVTFGGSPLDSLFEFDVTKKKWRRMKMGGYPPFPRMLHSSVYAYGKL
eukprot:jgi/Bigna1/74342/fgenesh1_pg.28_\